MSDDLVTRLRFLRRTAKFKFAKDQFYMVGEVMHEAAAALETLEREKAEGAFHPWKAALEATVERLSEELDEARQAATKMREALAWLSSEKAGMPDDIVAYVRRALGETR